ncbi:TonB-dependent receptor [Mucilaginibacter sp. PAMB04274]|uniref:TonB-dependent receptor plug domain-containing protein n=1 Tax=Mucilaginibacter sp. PAMB04274 TaxID=3138568 RepID=UPI0031F6A5D2
MELTELYTHWRAGFSVRFILTWVLVMLLVSHCFVLCAQVKKPAVDSLRNHHLQEVQIWSGAQSIPLASPTPVQLLKGAALERLSTLSVADAIRYFSGAQLKDYGGVGGLKTVDVRSMGSSQVAVFYDGIQLGNAQNGQVDLGKFSLDNIGEIELYNAQKGSIFQSARALAAGSVIYLTAKRPVFETGNNNHYKVAFKTGSLGLVNPSALWQHRISSKTYSTVSTEWTRASGRYPFRYTNGAYDTTATRNNGDIDALRIEAGLNGTLSDSSTWSVKTYLYNSERGLPGAIVANKFNYNQREWDRNLFIQSAYEKKGPVYSLLANAKYSRDYLRYLDPEIVTTTGFSDSRYHQQELYLSVTNQIVIKKFWNTAISADYLLNTMQSNIYRFTYPTRNTWLAAMATEVKWTRFIFQANVLGTFTHESTKAFEAAPNRVKYTPAVMASWQPLKSPDFKLRGFYKGLYRLPTFNELYYTFVGSTYLKPEYSQQYDAGFTFQHNGSQRLIKHIQLQMDVYYNRVADKIVAVPGQNLRRWTMENINRVNVYGIETRLQTGWQLKSSLFLNAGINYTYQKALDASSGSMANQQIPYTPLHNGALLAGLLWQQLSLNYSFIYTGERYNQSANIPANYVEPWYTHDVAAMWQTSFKGHQIKVGMDINNLLNQYYEVITNFPMPGRYYRLKFSLNY